MRINMADVPASSFELVPAGSYRCKITGAELKDSKNGPSEKNPAGMYVNFEFTIQEGSEWQGRKLWRTAPVSGKGLSILKETLMATELYADGELESEEFDLDLEVPLGADVNVSVKHEKRQDDPNEMQAAVSRVRPFTTGGTDLLP